MESQVRKMLKRNDYNRHKLLRKIKRQRKARAEQESKAAEKELKKKLRWTPLKKYEDGKDGTMVYLDKDTGLYTSEDGTVLTEMPNDQGPYRRWTDASGKIYTLQQDIPTKNELFVDGTDLYNYNQGVKTLQLRWEKEHPVQEWFKNFAEGSADLASEFGGGYGAALADITRGDFGNAQKRWEQGLPALSMIAAMEGLPAGATPYVTPVFSSLIGTHAATDMLMNGVNKNNAMEATMAALPGIGKGFNYLNKTWILPYKLYREIGNISPVSELLNPTIRTRLDKAIIEPEVPTIDFNTARQQFVENQPVLPSGLRINLRRKHKDLVFEQKYGDINDSEGILNTLNSENLSRQDLARLKRRAEKLELNDDVISRIDSAIEDSKIQTLKDLKSYSDIIKTIFKGDSKGAARSFLHLIDNNEIRSRINELYNQDVSENLRAILGDSYDPITGIWNRDLNVISRLANSDKETLSEFYKLLESYDRGNPSKDLSQLLKQEKYADAIKNGTFTGVHNVMTHNKYGEGNTLIERAKQSLLGLNDIGRARQSSFGTAGTEQSFSPNSVLINLKGLERTIRDRIKNKSLPVLIDRIEDGILNKYGKVKFIDDNGDYAAYLASYTDDVKRRAILDMARKDKNGASLINQDTGEPILNVEDFGLYKPSQEELIKENFQTIDLYADQIRNAYRRVIDAYNDLIEAFPNIFTENDRIHFNPDDVWIINGKRGGSPEERIPTIGGTSYMFRMNHGKDIKIPKFNKVKQVRFL